MSPLFSRDGNEVKWKRFPPLVTNVSQPARLRSPTPSSISGHLALRALLTNHYLGAGMRIRLPIFPVRRDQVYPFLSIRPSRLCNFPSCHALAKIAALLQVEFAIERLPDLSCMSQKVWVSALALYCQ